MVSPCFWVDLEEVVMVTLPEEVILEFGFLAAISGTVVGVALVALLVLLEPIDHMPFLFWRRPFDHRPIGLGDFAVFERLHHAAEAL